MAEQRVFSDYDEVHFSVSTGLDASAALSLFIDVPRVTHSGVSYVLLGEAVKWELGSTNLGPQYPGRLTSGAIIDVELSLLLAGSQSGTEQDWVGPVTLVIDRLVSCDSVREFEMRQSSEPVFCSWDGISMSFVENSKISPQLRAGVMWYLRSSERWTRAGNEGERFYFTE